MFPEANFVIVDDQEKELELLAKAFWRIGIPFRAYQYDSFQGIIDPPEAPLDSVRILAIDINLSEMTSPNPETVSTLISDVIKQLVAGGPYALIFWSKHTDLAKEIMDLLDDANRYPGLPKPIGFDVLDKIAFQISEDETDEASLDALKEKIKEVVEKFQTLNVLMSWESRVQKAAARTLCGFLEVSNSSEEELKTLLRSICIEAVGKSHATNNPTQAFEEGLTPILQDFLAHLPSAPAYQTSVTSLLDITANSPRLTAAAAAAARLNQFYTIAISPPPEKTSRGAWILINADDNQLTETLGKKREALFQEFLSFEKITDNAERRATRREVLSKCKLGLIELSAGCDHAQNKQRLNRYVLSAIIPNEYVCYSHFTFSGVTKDRAHEAIYRLVELNLPNQPAGSRFIIKVNARYTLGLLPSNAILGEALFRIKSPLIGAIARHHSDYHIRPGLVTFS